MNRKEYPLDPSLDGPADNGLDSLRLTRPATQARQTKPRSRRGKFLKGPIPMEWLRTAMRLKGRALHVGVMLWHFRGLRRSDTFKVGLGDLGQGVISRYTVRRALSALAGVGLIEVTGKPGQKLRVTVRHPEGDGSPR